MDAGNGGAGLVIDKLEPHLPFEFIKVRHEPNGNFPQGVPNPMLEENRGPTLEALRKHGADVGHRLGRRLRPLLFLRLEGPFIEGYYIVGLLAEASSPSITRRAHRLRPAPHLEHHRHGEALGGVPVMSKSGHAFIKQKMRERTAPTAAR